MNPKTLKGIATGAGLATGIGGAYALGRSKGQQSQEKKVVGLRSLYNSEIQNKREQLSRQNEAVSRFLTSYAASKRQGPNDQY